MSAAPVAYEVAYEVAVPFLELEDAAGHKHYLSAGADLPSWVTGQTLADLRAAGALNQFGVI